MPDRIPAGLARLNSADGETAARLLREVCSCRAWSDALLAGRPYAGAGALCAANDTAMAALTADDLREAMAGHPPIGRPAPGDPTSAREQRGMARAAEDLKAELLELNLAYQQRFGHVFLICATGRSAETMLAALRERSGNDPATEREIVRGELRKINDLRLDRLLQDS
jgi:2-oxo-4-hydroxy-4-carboxy-5-ureidoimidazoline decarboxylase